MSKILWSQTGCWWQYGGALHDGLVRLHSRKHTPAPVHPPPHTHIYNTYCFSTATMASWTRLSVTLHVHCLSRSRSIWPTARQLNKRTVFVYLKQHGIEWFGCYEGASNDDFKKCGGNNRDPAVFSWTHSKLSRRVRSLLGTAELEIRRKETQLLGTTIYL